MSYLCNEKYLRHGFVLLCLCFWVFWNLKSNYATNGPYLWKVCQIFGKLKKLLPTRQMKVKQKVLLQISMGDVLIMHVFQSTHELIKQWFCRSNKNNFLWKGCEKFKPAGLNLLVCIRWSKSSPFGYNCWMTMDLSPFTLQRRSYPNNRTILGGPQKRRKNSQTALI